MVLNDIRYYTGYPRKEQISRVQDFKSERQFVELLHQGQPVAVAFTLRFYSSQVKEVGWLHFGGSCLELVSMVYVAVHSLV